MTLEGLANALQKPAIVLVLWTGVFDHWYRILVTLPWRVYRFDWSLYYTAALMLRLGTNPYVKDISLVGEQLGLEIWSFRYAVDSPFMLLLLEPFTLLPPQTGYWIWFGINTASLISSVFLLCAPRFSGLKWREAWILSAIMLLYQPVAENFAYAQTQIVILLLLVIAYRCLQRGADQWAGVLIAIAGALRIYPLLLGGFFLFSRRWRGLKAMIGTLAAIGAVLMISPGFSTCISFVHGLFFHVNPVLRLLFPVSLLSFVSRVFWYLGYADFGAAPSWGRIIVAISADFVVLFVTIRATVRADHERAFPLWIVSAILLSPIAWLHYLVLNLLLFGCMAEAAVRGECSNRCLWLGGVSYVLTAAAIPLHDISAMLGVWAYRIENEFLFTSVVLLYLAALSLALDRAPKRAETWVDLTVVRPISARPA